MGKKILYGGLLMLSLLIIVGCDSRYDSNLNNNEQSESLSNNSASNEVVNSVKVVINDREYTINLENNETVKSFISLLPQEFNMDELNGNEKYVILLSGIMFILGFVTAGLNYRFGWLCISNKVVIISSIIFIIAYILYAEVLRENAFLLRTIEVEKNQKVIDSGFYGVVRHPMYAVTVLLFLTMPLVLGSVISFLIFLIYPFIIVKRIKNEEKVLEKDLKGYKQYKKKVKYKMIPFIW